jgi:hypothetical protein
MVLQLGGALPATAARGYDADNKNREGVWRCLPVKSVEKR